MPIKVTIVKGKGRISCLLPGFHLDEKTRPFAIVEETTEQLDKLEKRGLITIGEVSENEMDKMLEKVSKRLTVKARKKKLEQLKIELKTGGVSQTEYSDGVKETVAPAVLTPDEVKAVAAAEIKAIEKGDPSGLNSIIGSLTEA